jgi:hypothetical protein
LEILTLRTTKYRLAASLIALAAAWAVQAQTYGIGVSTVQVDVVSMGADISLNAEIGTIYLPEISGNATANYSTTSNGSDYFTTSSYSEVFTTGYAYEEAGEGVGLFFTNSGAVDESVTVSWEGYAASDAYTTLPDPPSYSWDYAAAYLEDGSTRLDVLLAQVETETYGVTSGSDAESGDYTITLAPGQSDELAAVAYNESYSVVAPGPAAILPFAFGGLSAALRRRRRRA